MVKKRTKLESELEKKIGFSNEEINEDFIEANQYLVNEALNEDDEANRNDFDDDKDDRLLEKLRSLDGRRR